MDRIFERIYWDLYKLKSIGKENVFKQLDSIVDVSKIGYNALIAYGERFDALYDANINSISFESKEFLIFMSEIKSISSDSYEFLTSGHDILNINTYLKFKDLDYVQKLKMYKEYMNFTVYLRYSFKKIINEPDKEKQKIMLKGMLGM